MHFRYVEYDKSYATKLILCIWTRNINNIVICVSAWFELIDLNMWKGSSIKMIKNWTEFTISISRYINTLIYILWYNSAIFFHVIFYYYSRNQQFIWRIFRLYVGILILMIFCCSYMYIGFRDIISSNDITHNEKIYI